MAIGAITMILTNVGLQMYNNWCGSRQNAELQRKREEFERAARERNTEHMWRLLREGQELTMQLEEERHHHRLDELKNEIDNLLEKLTYETAISNWPLKVLPIVMKNQAFGNLLANQEDNIAMHVILTRSNYDIFNTFVFPVIEKNLEQYCNEHWSMSSDHPVLFYSGAWKPLTAPTDVQVSSMRTALSNLPTLLITPFFRPNDGKLVFHINLWGIGASDTDQFSVPEIEPNDFQRSFNNQDDYDDEEGLLEEIVEDLVPYLECLIGYMADTYFWSSAGSAPNLPHLITKGEVNTDGMKYLVIDCCEYYFNLLQSGNDYFQRNPFIKNDILNLYEGSAEIWDEDTQKKTIEDIFVSYCANNSRKDLHSMSECLSLELLSKEDLPFIKKFRSIYLNENYQKELEKIQRILEYIDFDYSIMNSTNVSYLEGLVETGDKAAMFRLGEIYEYSIGIDRYDPTKAAMYYTSSLEHDFVLAEFYSLIHDENSEVIRCFSDEELCVLNRLHSKGVITASIFLSQYYYYGPQKDKNKVLKYLEEAPETNHPYLYYWAAKVLMDFQDVNKNESIEYNMEKSANYGYIEAQTFLMKWFQKKGNSKKSFEYASKAAQQGSIQGISQVGYCLLTGYGTSKDKSRGAQLLKMAAQKGDLNAISLLKEL